LRNERINSSEYATERASGRHWERFSQRAHESLLSISYENLRGRNSMHGKDVVESLKIPRLTGLAFFGKETERK